MGAFSKPTDLKFISEHVSAVYKEAAAAKQKDFRAPPHHLQTVIDGFNLFVWPLCPNSEDLKDYLNENYNAIFFFGNKVLKLDKDLDTAWFNAYKEVAHAHYEFVNSRLDSILEWGGSVDGAEAFIKGDSQPVAAASSAATSAPSTVSSGAASSEDVQKYQA